MNFEFLKLIPFLHKVAVWLLSIFKTRQPKFLAQVLNRAKKIEINGVKVFEYSNPLKGQTYFVHPKIIKRGNPILFPTITEKNGKFIFIIEIVTNGKYQNIYGNVTIWDSVQKTPYLLVDNGPIPLWEVDGYETFFLIINHDKLTFLERAVESDEVHIALNCGFYWYTVLNKNQKRVIGDMIKVYNGLL